MCHSCTVAHIRVTVTLYAPLKADNREYKFNSDRLMCNGIFTEYLFQRNLFVHLCVFLFSVEGGHRAVIFDRFQGVKPDVTGEGTHFLIPWVQRPIIFDIRSRPRNVPVITGSKGQ